MVSNHKRNVSGMHNAARCGALTPAGFLCGAPAVAGKQRCHMHGGKGSKSMSHARRLSDYSKASLERDRQIKSEIKKLDKEIRKLERGGVAEDILAGLDTIRRGLRRITQQKQADLAASYVPGAADPKAARDVAVLRTRLRSASGHPSIELVRDRAMGAMIGLAVGEAVGITLKNRPSDPYRPISDMVGFGELGLKPGQWASDTAMALALLDSLRFRRELDETDLMERLLEWEEEGIYSCTGSCVGIGRTTKEALAGYRLTGDPIAGSTYSESLTNGSLVRVAPVAIRYWNEPGELRDVAARQSRTTHADPCVVEACVAFAEVLADAISGEARAVVLGAREVPQRSPISFIMAGSWKNRKRAEIRSDENVLNSLEAALWCVDKTFMFDEAVLRATNLGGDAGSTAALAGALAGALYGASAIPPGWSKRVAWSDQIVKNVDALFDQGIRPQPRT